MKLSGVVNLTEYKCRAGAMAMHSEFGLVEVQGHDGWMRCILIERREQMPIEIPGALSAERIEIVEEWVHVRELVEADLARDVEYLRKRGQLIGCMKLDD
jgi:hypothetical protein